MFRQASQSIICFTALLILQGLLCRSAEAVLIHHYPIENESAGSLADAAGFVDLFYTDVTAGSLSTDAVASGSTQSFQLVAGQTARADFADELFQSASFSAALWYREGTGGSSNPAIFGVIESATPFQHNFLIRDAAPGGGNLRFFSRDNSDNTIDVVSSTQINDGQWHHLAATFDSSTLAANLYVDGNVTGSATFTGWTGWNQFTQTFAGLGNPGASLPGTYDEVRLYNHALTPAEVEDLARVAFLEVDRQAGTIDLVNESGAAISIAGYSITSARGSLVTSNWMSITDNYDGNDGAEIDSSNWSILTDSATEFSESANSPGNGSIANGATFRLGDSGAWLSNPIEDLNIEINLNGGGMLSAVTRFVGAPISEADINGDGIVDEADWLLFRGNLNGPMLDPGLTAAQLFREGDIDGDFDVDRVDFLTFKAAFIAATSPAAFDSATGGAVPEPGTVTIALLGGLMLIAFAYLRNSQDKHSMKHAPCKIHCVGLVIVVAASLSAQTASAVLVHHWNVEGDSPGTLTDSVGGVDLLYTDPDEGSLSPLGAAPGIGSSQGFVTATGGDATSANASDLFMSGSFSLALWTQRVQATGSASPMLLGVIENGSGFNHNYLIRSLSNGTNLAFFSRDNLGGATNTMSISSSADLSDLGWHHVAATFDWSGTVGDSATGRIYVDGVETGTQTIANWQGWTAGDMTQGGIGQAGFTPVANYDDLRIYDHVLSVEEIEELATTTAVFTLGLEVNTVSGEITLVNNTGAAVDIDYYEIRSATGDLVIGGAAPGDYNQDGTTNAADYAVWRDNLGGSGQGDGTGDDLSGVPDGDVDQFDYDYWRANFGATGGSGGWNSLQDQDFENNGAPGSGNGWEEGDNVSASYLFETYLTGSSPIPVDAAISLGNAFMIGGTESLTFEYHLANTGNQFIVGGVDFVTSGSLQGGSSVPEPTALLQLGMILVGVLGVARARRSWSLEA